METKQNQNTQQSEESDSPKSPHQSSKQFSPGTTKINPRKVLDEVYDVYLVTIPSNFQDALDKVQDAKVQILEKYFPEIGGDGSQDFDNLEGLETITDADIEQADKSFEKYGEKQVKIVEKYINACLMDRMTSEKHFRFLNKLLQKLEIRLSTFFNAVFTRQSFVNQSQIVKKFNFDHLPFIEANVYSILRQELSKIKEEEKIDSICDDLYLPSFFVDYHLSKCKSMIQDWYDDFLKKFTTPFEEHWQIYVEQKHKVFEEENEWPEVINQDLFQISFDILCRLKIPLEIKNEIEHVKSKLFMFSVCNDLSIDEDNYFTGVKVSQKIKFNEIINEQFSDKDKEEVIYAILFRIILFMVQDNYTALDREILKQFIEAFQSILVEFIINSYEVSPHFFLTVIEKICAQQEESPLDIDLKDLAFSKRYQWFIKKFKIDQVLVFSSILKLQKISEDNLKSKHIVIAISGFLTEDIDKKDSWREVVSHFKDSEVYALDWNSLSVKNFWYEGHLKYKSGKKRVMSVLKFISTGKKQFRYCVNQAKAAGTILAIFLIKEDFCENKCISILGFSLGTVITLECVKALSKFYQAGNLKAGRILSDIYLMGGAAVLGTKDDEDNQEEWNIFCQMINGRLSNVYSKADMVLKYMFSFISTLKPIGLRAIFEEENRIDPKKFKKAFNYDCTLEAPGHMTYMEVQEKLLSKIPYSY